MIVVAYCRYSSEAQRDGYSIDAQKRAIADWAPRQGHSIARFYVDEARSGTSDDREQFQQMIKDSASGTFEAVVVHKLDRFARDRYDSAVYRHKLKVNGVRILSVLEPLDDSPESIIMESVLEGMAEYYSKNLAREVMKGKKEAAMKAQYNGGFIPLGYSVGSDKKFVLEPSEAKVVKEVYSRFVSGDTLTVIATDLTSRGIKGKGGGTLTGASLGALISNCFYCGRYAYNRKSKSQAPIYVDDVIPAIVTVQMWEEANSKLTKTGPRKKDPSYLLTGYLFTECCSKPYVGNVSYTKYKTKDGTVKSCESRTYLRRHSCPGCSSIRSVKKDAIEEFVIGSIEKVLFSGSTLDWVVSELRARLESRKASPRDVAVIEARISKIKIQKDRLLDLYITGGIDKAVYGLKSAELIKAEELATQELKSASGALSALPTVEELKSLVSRFISSASSDSFEYKKRLLATFVERVTLSNNGVVVYFRFPIPGTGESISAPAEGLFADKRKSDYVNVMKKKLLR